MRSTLAFMVMTAALAFALSGCGNPNLNDVSSNGSSHYLASTDPNSDGSGMDGQDQGQGQGEQQGQQSQVCKDKSCQQPEPMPKPQPKPMPKPEPKTPEPCKGKNCQNSQGNEGGQDQGGQDQGENCQDASGGQCTQTVAAHETIEIPDLTGDVEPVDHIEPMHVKFGTKVTWKNSDRGPVAVESDEHTFSSGPINDGGDFSVVFDKLGSYRYHYKIDDQQKAPGLIVVHPR